jgi:hypothetical protein
MSPHQNPCTDLSTLKKMFIAYATLTTGIMLLSFGFATASYVKTGESDDKVNQVLRKQIEVIENQKTDRRRIDEALQKANTALAISAKTEANIEWIRTGQTELKTLVLNYLGVKNHGNTSSRMTP